MVKVAALGGEGQRLLDVGGRCPRFGRRDHAAGGGAVDRLLGERQCLGPASREQKGRAGRGNGNPHVISLVQTVSACQRAMDAAVPPASAVDRLSRPRPPPSLYQTGTTSWGDRGGQEL